MVCSCISSQIGKTDWDFSIRDLQAWRIFYSLKMTTLCANFWRRRWRGLVMPLWIALMAMMRWLK